MRRLLSLALIALSSTQAVRTAINARATASIPQYVLEYGNPPTQYLKARTPIYLPQLHSSTGLAPQSGNIHAK
jgi:hypothetical protein